MLQDGAGLVVIDGDFGILRQDRNNVGRYELDLFRNELQCVLDIDRSVVDVPDAHGEAIGCVKIVEEELVRGIIDWAQHIIVVRHRGAAAAPGPGVHVEV